MSTLQNIQPNITPDYVIKSLNSLNPLIASTNIDPTLFLDPTQQVFYPGELEALVGLNNKKRQLEQDVGQRKNLSHVPNATAAVVNSAQAAPAAGVAKSDAHAAAPARKKPGRKPATTEPTNKRTAQNRAAQRAFRERKERYVKELETRVAELEDAQRKAESGTLLAENEKLRKKLSQLESENSVLREMSFTFEYPITGVNPAVASSIPTTVPTSIPSPPASSSAGQTPQQANMDGSPSFSQSSPFSSGSTDVPSLDGESYGESYSLFDTNSTTSGINNHPDLGDLTSPTLNPDHDQILQSIFGNSTDVTAGGVSDPFSILSTTSPSPSQQYTTTDFSKFSSPSFTAYRDTPNDPFTPTFDNPSLPIFNDNEFDDLLNLGAATQSPPPSSDANKGDGTNPCAALKAEIKDLIDDNGAIDELCQIFTTKAQCSEMKTLQSQIISACESGKKDEVMDLLMVAKEKKRMHMLRIKAGVTTLAPEFLGM
ncbi:hypothetical protein HK104_009137 [Borealophlyctis nickersoniae]|nr:hypothetical protein HK104_009137 [Borealophlyctis nickersoniae]